MPAIRLTTERAELKWTALVEILGFHQPNPLVARRRFQTRVEFSSKQCDPRLLIRAWDKAQHVSEMIQHSESNGHW